MSKLHQSDLFDLIKSLSKSEKRHFKVFASKHVIGEENHYVKLFDAIEVQAEYDEKAIQLNESYISQLPQLKNRLYEIILKSLDVFYGSTNIEAILKNKLHHIKLLQQKKLFSQARQSLQKTKKTAYEQEQFNVLIELISLETNLIASLNYADSNEKDLTRLYAESKEVMHKLQNLNDFRLLTQLMFLNIRRHGILRDSELKKKYKQIMSDKLLMNVNNAGSYRAKYFYYLLKSTYYWNTKEFERSYILIKEHIRLMETNMLIVNESPRQYVDILTNLLICLLHQKKFSEIRTNIEKLQSIKIKSQQLDFHRSCQAFVIEISFVNETGNFENGLLALKKFEKIAAEMKTTLEDVFKSNINLPYDLGYMYFGLGDYKKSLKYLNIILNDTGKIRSDLYGFAKIMSLLIHYELGNLEFLKYAITSTHKFLHKKDRLFKVETLFMNFIRKNYQMDNSSKLDKALTELKKSFLEFEDDDLEKTAFSNFDFISWIDSKLKKKSYAALIKEKANHFFN